MLIIFLLRTVQVTSRQLLQMRGGLQDYEDTALYEWTITHPNEDYLPIQYLETVNKTFLFPPQKGGFYSGTGYVMAGMALAAARGNHTWDTLHQRYIFSKLSESEQFDNTVRIHCSFLGIFLMFEFLWCPCVETHECLTLFCRSLWD